MARNNQIFEDLSKMAQSTFTTMVNLKNEITQMIHDQLKSSLKSMDLVTKADLEVLKRTVHQLQQANKEHMQHCHKHECSKTPKDDSSCKTEKCSTAKTKVKVVKKSVKSAAK